MFAKHSFAIQLNLPTQVHGKYLFSFFQFNLFYSIGFLTLSPTFYNKSYRLPWSVCRVVFYPEIG